MLNRLTVAVSLASLALLAGCGDSGTDKAETPAAPANAAPAGDAAAASAAELATVTPEKDQEARALTTRLLDEAAGQMARDNFMPAAGQTDHHVHMGLNRTDDWTVNLTGGQTYRIVGVCNHGCENIDLELRDASGAVVASDVLDDDVPIVEVAPAADAAYTARLIMKACDSAPCLASARVFQRR